MASPKISVYSLADLKNTSDDAVPNYLNSLKFKQSYTLSDVRLAIGFVALAVAAATFAWDYKLGFESTKYYTAAAVLLYSCLNGALTYWMWFVEKGKIYVGTSPSGEKIEIATSTIKHVPNYNLTISFYTAAQPTIPNTIKISRPFSEWFDASGNFMALPFQQMFASAVPIIATADPTKAIKTSSTGGSKAIQANPVESSGAQAVEGTANSSGAKVGGVDAPVSTNAGKKSKGRKKA